MNAFEMPGRIGRVGLRPRLIILVLVAVAPLVSLLVAGATADRQFALANAQTQAIELARLGAERQADTLQEARELLSVLRRMPEINGGESQVCQAAVKIIAADHPQFNTIGVADADGTITCHNLITKRQTIGDIDLFRQAIAPGAPLFTVGKFVIGQVSGKPTMVMASPLPNAADGVPKGIVFAGLNLESFERVTANLVGSLNRTALVVDTRTGVVLAYAPVREPMIGRSFSTHPLVRALIAAREGGSVETDGLTGVPEIFGFAPLPISGARDTMVAVGLSRAEVLADANGRFQIGLWITVLALAGALGAAWLFGDISQIKPIRALVDTAQNLGRGQLSTRSTLEPWQAPEFRVLGSTLNDMAAAIELAQKNLQESETQLRMLADNATDMIFKLDLDFRRTYVSPACRDILGYEPSELIGQRPANMAHPEDSSSVTRSYHELLSGQGRSTTVSRIQHRDGHWVWIEVHKRALLDPETGAPLGITGTLRDISARKAAEDAVRANEALLQGVFDHTPDCILVHSVDPNGTFPIETCNRAAATVAGLSLDDMSGKPLGEVLPPACAEKMIANLEQCVAACDVVHVEYASVFGDDRRQWDVNLVPIVDCDGNVSKVVVTARDTTERHLAEDMVRESGERYRLIADNVADVVVRLGPELGCHFVSSASRHLLGCEPEELIALPLVDIIHPEDRDAFLDDMKRLRAGSPVTEFRFRARRHDGSYTWVEATGQRLSDRGDVILAIRDISRRKQIESELEAANHQLQVLALQDGLTGLANRRSFSEVFDSEWRRAARERSPLGLIMLDLDKFKAYNDTYGHQAGDDCLCAVARLIERSLQRPADFVARYGGEEFVIVLPNTDEAGTIEVAERVRRSVAAAALEHRGNAGGIVTISAGTWAAGTGGPSNPRAALKSADKNLYVAKAQGRNRVVHSSLLLSDAI